MKRWKSIVLILILFTIGFSIGFIPMWIENNKLGIVNTDLTNTIEKLMRIFIPNVTIITENMYIIIDYETFNRTVYLDVSKDYCEAAIFKAGNDTFYWDSIPNAKIIFFFIEDIVQPELFDNYSDLIVRMNPIIDKDNRAKMVVVFFAEGGYDKFVFYNDELIYHYEDDNPASNYGIVLIDMETWEITD